MPPPWWSRFRRPRSPSRDFSKLRGVLRKTPPKSSSARGLCAVPPLSRSGTVSNFGFQGREGLGRDKQEHSVPTETAGHLLGHLLNRCDLPQLAGQAPPPPGTGTCGAVPAARTGSAALTPGAPRAPRSLRTPGAGCQRKGRPPGPAQKLAKEQHSGMLWNADLCDSPACPGGELARAGGALRPVLEPPRAGNAWGLSALRGPSERCLRRRRRPLGAETAGTSGGPGRVPSAPAVLPARRGPRWSHAGPHALPPTRPQPCPPWGLHPRTVRPCPRHVSKYKSQEGRLRPQTCPRTGTQRRRTWRLPRPRGWARPAAEAPPRPLPHPWPAGATVPGQPRAPCRPLLHTVRELPDGGDRRGGADRALSPPESQGGAGGRLGGKAGGAGSWTQHRSAPRRCPAATRSHTPRQDRPTSPKTHRLLCVGSEAKSHLELPRCLHEKHSLRALCDGDGGYGGESQAPPPTALPKYLPGNLQPGRPSLPSLTSDTVKDFQRTRSN